MRTKSKKVKPKESAADKLCEVPYSERVILLPQCLRSNQCKAPRSKYGVLECQDCRQDREDELPCPIPYMIDIAKEIGYRDVYVLTGGRGIEALMKEEGLPRGVVAIACHPEIEEGVSKMEKLNIPYQIAYLVQDGCAETKFIENQNLENLTEEWREVLTKYPPVED